MSFMFSKGRKVPLEIVVCMSGCGVVLVRMAGGGAVCCCCMHGLCMWCEYGVRGSIGAMGFDDDD